MNGAIFLLGTALFGIGLVRRFFATTLNHAEQGLWGLVIGWSLATVIGYAFARMWGELSFQATLLTVLVIWSGAIVSWLPDLRGWRRQRGPIEAAIWQPSYTPLALLLCVAAPVYLRLFITHMLQPGADGGLYSGGESSYFDMAYHAAVTTSFVHGANFPPIYTPMPPAPLLYPFLPDFLTALLVAMGMDLHSALVWTAVPMSLALTGTFYFFALRVLGLTPIVSERCRAVAAAVATLMFLLNGGLGFVCFIHDWQTSGESLWHFLSNLKVNYTHVISQNMVWPNIITDMLLPQRTSLFGLSLGFVILTCFVMTWRTATENQFGEKWRDWKVLLAAGILAGLLPFFHVHSYAAVGLISGFLFLLRPRRVWLVFWLPAVVLAFPRFLELTGPIGATGFLRLQPGWRGQGEPNWPLFWLRNVGLPTLLIVPAWFSASRSLRLFYISFIALLFLALLVVFSPNDYDNLKLMTYWYAATCVVVAAWLTRLGQHRLGRVCSIAFVILSIASGLLALPYEWQSRKPMFDKDEVGAAEFGKTKTAPHSIFLTASSLHQPILSLAGRAVVRGPTAWLWSHGYPFAEREADVRAIYAGRDDALELLRYYRVDYIYLGRREVEDLKANRGFFDAAFPPVYQAGEITIYDARKLRDNKATEGMRRFAPYPAREYASRIGRDPAQFLAEFPTVAYRVYRLHKVAWGEAPGYGDFMTALRQLGANLFLQGRGWRDTLEMNERALINEWTRRPIFTERYGSLTDGQYVTALYANAGLTPSERERTDLTEALTSGRETRASVLQKISGDRRLYLLEYNAAYVLCHYFGYLKRNPDDAPDHDLTGYNFWRTELDRTRDYRGLTRAFLEADEYKVQQP